MYNLYFNRLVKKTRTKVILFSFFICSIWRMTYTHTYTKKQTKILLKNKKKRYSLYWCLVGTIQLLNRTDRKEQPKRMDETKIKLNLEKKSNRKCIAEQ